MSERSGADRALDEALAAYSRRGRMLLVASALLSLVLLGLAVLVLAVNPPDEPMLQVGHLALHHHTRRWLWLSTAILGTPVLFGRSSCVTWSSMRTCGL